MLKVNLFGLNEEVEIDENNLESYEEYEETCLLEDGRRVAYDEAVCGWVMLG